MEELVKQRIKEILGFYNVSQNKFANGDMAFQKRLSNQLNGKTPLSFQTCMTILERFPEISAEWLLRGEGSMLKPHHNSTYNINNDSECLGASSCPIDDTARGLALYDQLERDTFLAQLDAIIERKINARLERMLNVG